MLMPLKRFFRFSCFLILPLFLHASCATMTGPGVSSEEIAQREPELEAKAERYRTAQEARVRTIAERLVSFMPAEDQAQLKDFHYEVSDSPDMNANVDNSRMQVNYGLLRFVDSDDELAVVIAHELAHVVKGHYGKSIASSVLATTAGIAAGVAIDSVAAGAGTIVGQGLSMGIKGGLNRDLEREADYFGFQYVYLAGFDLQKGIGVWERFVVEAPKANTLGLLSTHPPAIERLIRAEKTLKELQSLNIQPHTFNRPEGTASVSVGPSLLNRTLAVPGNMVTGSLATVASVVKTPMSLADGNNASTGKPSTKNAAVTAAPSDEQKEIEALKKEIQRMQEAEAERKKLAQDQASAQVQKQRELEEALLTAREVSKEQRFAKFSIKDMGIAAKVTNLWLGQTVSGEQLLFPLDQRKIDWFMVYSPFSFRAFTDPTYRAYWYAPNGKLFSEQSFKKSKIRSDFVKTTLEWDPALGDFLIGKWLVRVFVKGELVDERNFEIIK